MDRLTIVKRLGSLRTAVFTLSQISALFDKPIESTRVLLSRLVKDDVLVRVKRGHYCVPSTPVLSIASSIYVPSYVSLWAAFEYYGTTTQTPQIIDTVNTEKSGKRELSVEEGTFTLRFVKTNESFMYGIKKVYLDGKTTFIAEKEKAIIDGLLFHNYVPLEEVIEAIRNGIDRERAITYANMCGKQVVMKRLGYLVDREGEGCDPGEFGKLSDTYVPLDPSFPRRGSYDSTWRIIDNRRKR